MERLHGFAKDAFKNPDQRTQWLNQQEELLQEDEAKTVIANISLMTCKGKAKQGQRTILTYYENNLKRMNYKTYRDQDRKSVV